MLPARGSLACAIAAPTGAGSAAAYSPRIPSSSTARVANDRTDLRGATPAGATPIRELPNDIWGMVANLSSRDVVLNLRAVNHAVKSEMEHSITHIALCGGKEVADFVSGTGFNYLQRLRLTRCNDHDVELLVTALEKKPRRSLLIEITQITGAHLGPAAHSALNKLPHASLRLIQETLGTAEAASLAQVGCPISLHFTFWSHFDRNSLLAASTLPTLITLDLPRHNFFDDEIAHAFSTHAKLQTLILPSAGEMSEMGVRKLAEVPTLRMLTIGEMRFPVSEITTGALAASTTLEHLLLAGSAWPLGAAAVQALATSVSLRKLTLSVSAGAYHLAGMESLQTLQLIGDPQWTRTSITRNDAIAFSQNSRLKSIEIAHAQFETGSLNLLAAQVRAKDLRLTSVEFDENTVPALCTNTHLSSLRLWNVRGPLAAATLTNHPTLQRLSCGGSYPYNAPFDRIEALAAAAVWLGRGRSPDDLGGHLGSWHLSASYLPSPDVDVGSYHEHWGTQS